MGGIWICTNIGVYKINFTKNKFHQLFHHHLSNNIENQVRGIYADNENIYANVWRSIKIKSNDKIKEINTPIVNFPLLSYNNELFGASNFLYKVLLDKNKIEIFENSSSSEIMSMFPDSDSTFIIGRTNGLEHYNIRTKEIKKLKIGNAEIHLPYKILKKKR